VDNPLVGPQGASAVFGPQKGAGPADVVRLDAALARLAGVLQRLEGCPPGLAALPGGGAAGGLGAALLALGARRESGIGLVRRLSGLDAALAGADLAVTGEGAFDAQSLRGKVVAGVAAATRATGVPCLVLAGRVAVDPADAAAAGVAGARSLVARFGADEALGRPAEALRRLAAEVARDAHRGWVGNVPGSG
jgi:glycerate kinase